MDYLAATAIIAAAIAATIAATATATAAEAIAAAEEQNDQDDNPYAAIIAKTTTATVTTHNAKTSLKFTFNTYYVWMQSVVTEKISLLKILIFHRLKA